MSASQNSSDDCLSLRDIIQLQLKKPKSWNWELSTSKSSPHIMLPTIKLYNSKGKLLVEARDNGTQRQSWHSSGMGPTTTATKINNNLGFRDSIPRHLRKCRSEIFDDCRPNKNASSVRKKSSDSCKSSDDVRPTNGKTFIRLRKSSSAASESRPKASSHRHHQQTRSDDVYQRMMKHNEESIKRAIADGYRSFIKPRGLDTNDIMGEYKQTSAKNFPTNNNFTTMEVNHVKPKRYETRTCSAGTLIISGESFNDLVRRRRRNETSGDATKPASGDFENNNDADKRAPAEEIVKKCSEACEKIVPGDDNNNYCDYIVEEPVTPSGEVKQRPLFTSPEKLPRRKRRKRRKSRKAEEIERSNISGNAYKEETASKDVVGDAKLLRLVRRLSSHDNDNAKMGANVSRHSSKGLHGRRSQSSGSICNGKGRHGSASDSKICGSLPSYLDDRIGTTCNNNHHECEKQPHDVERIPPLGDAAPLHWKFSDTQAVLLCDQGYGSERSPEEEYPPSLPGHEGQCLHHMDPHSCYPFITPENVFGVALTKGLRGLGLSVSGGADSAGSWPGLIRIKRLFPHQPASSCGLLNVGDLLLAVNGITLTGLTNYEALEVLRTSPNHIELTVCRPPLDVLSCVSPISEVPPPPPRRDPLNSFNLTPPPYQPTPEDDLYNGEFDITLTKIQGSLGFTLRKEDDSALGHYVRALVREPALSDGRIVAGDKIIAVNDVEISSMSHEQAVQYLRQAGDVVTLRLYRDASQTPVSTLSPAETTPRASFSRKAHLRPEALDMLNDIALRKIGNPETYTRSLSSPHESPRRLRRQPYSSDSSQAMNNSAKHVITEEQFHEGLFRKPTLPQEDEEDTYNSLFSVDSDDCDRPSRPSSLDLNSKGTPVITRKPKFNFSLAHNAYELNNLDPEILDAPNLTYNLGKEDGKSTEVECGDNFPQEPVSMPHMPSDNPEFSYKNPAYQSAHAPCASDCIEAKVLEENNMKKWKGVVLKPEEELKKETIKKVVKVENKYVVLSIELNRGWNSRLGFSLQGAAGVTYVSAVHADSVAAKDGRLKPGDCLLKVNDESVESMSTSEIIDLLRIVRGPVCIVVSRCQTIEDCLKSNVPNN